MKKIIIVVLMLIMVVSFVGCSQADRVSHNISKEADRFNVTRRLAVINARSDKPVFEIIGNFSISNNVNNELETRRGRKLYPNYIIVVENQEFKII